MAQKLALSKFYYLEQLAQVLLVAKFLFSTAGELQLLLAPLQAWERLQVLLRALAFSIQLFDLRMDYLIF